MSIISVLENQTCLFRKHEKLNRFKYFKILSSKLHLIFLFKGKTSDLSKTSSSGCWLSSNNPLQKLNTNQTLLWMLHMKIAIKEFNHMTETPPGYWGAWKRYTRPNLLRVGLQSDKKYRNSPAVSFWFLFLPLLTQHISAWQLRNSE